MNSLKGWLWVVIGLALPSMVHGTELSAALDTGGKDWVPRDTRILVRLSQPPEPGTGRIAILVGPSDYTDLFRFDGETFSYRPELQLLPPGENEVAVYLVSEGEPWSEVGRFPLRVLHTGGFKQVQINSRIDLESIARLDDGPEETGEKTGFQDATSQFAVQGGFGLGDWKVEGSLNVVGVTDREKALRFADEGAEAQKVDLSLYSVLVSRGQSRLSFGHQSFGQGRHLIESFSSRGLSLELPLGSWGQFGLGLLNGSSIVGWDNLIGLDDHRHRIAVGHLRGELVPKQPGRLRFSISTLDGSLLPQSGFNQGQINDRETSRGWSLEVGSTALSSRFRFTGSYAESRFENPADALLEQGSSLVPVETETRGAQSTDLAFDLFQNRGHKKPTTLTLAWRHQEIEPQYRSVGAFVQADRREDIGEMTLTSGPMSFQVMVAEARDNLDDVPSILTTRTRRSGTNILIPFGQLRSEKPRLWAPTLSLSVDRTHQFGDGIPQNSGFNESHVPDQVSLNQNLSLQWQLETWRLAYTLGHSDQDNRQPGRDSADFDTLVQSLSLGWTPFATLDLGIDLSRERADNSGLGEIAETSRYGINVSWQQAPWSSVTGTASRTEGLVSPISSRQENEQLDLQWTVRLDRPFSEGHGFSAQLYLRYSLQDSRSEDPVFGLDQAFRLWSITSGINLSLF